MRLILFLLLIAIYIPSNGQIKNLPNLSHYENYNGILFDYSAYNELELTEKYFGFNLKGIISEKAYSYFDLNRLGSKEGEINVIDTIFYSDKLTQNDKTYILYEANIVRILKKVYYMNISNYEKDIIKKLVELQELNFKTHDKDIKRNIINTFIYVM